MQLLIVLFTNALQARALQEGWQLTLCPSGFRVTARQPDSTLADHAAAVTRARNAGLPCQDDGTFPTNTIVVPS